MMMECDKFEKDLEQACEKVQQEFTRRFQEGLYISAVGSKLETFIDDLQEEYEALAVNFIKAKKLENDAAARKRVLTVARQYAKKCTEEFSKIK